ncbi:MAG: pentapeptide repeat-containing protein, partial [Cyanobacteria bacterium P01_H01_bin.152]
MLVVNTSTTPEEILAAVQAGESLSEGDFYQFNFHGLALQKAILPKAILVKVNFKETQLSGA